MTELITVKDFSRLRDFKKLPTITNEDSKVFPNIFTVSKNDVKYYRTYVRKGMYVEDTTRYYILIPVEVAVPRGSRKMVKDSVDIDKPTIKKLYEKLFLYQNVIKSLREDRAAVGILLKQVHTISSLHNPDKINLTIKYDNGNLIHRRSRYSGTEGQRMKRIFGI